MTAAGDHGRPIAGRLRAVLVDDHAGFRRAARALLEQDGIDIVGEAEDGETLAAEAGRLAPDVVILDVRLAREDGIAVAARLGALDEAPPVVLVSSRTREELGLRELPPSVTGFLPKDQLSGPAVRSLLGAARP